MDQAKLLEGVHCITEAVIDDVVARVMAAVEAIPAKASDPPKQDVEYVESMVEQVMEDMLSNGKLNALIDNRMAAFEQRMVDRMEDVAADVVNNASVSINV